MHSFVALFFGRTLNPSPMHGVVWDSSEQTTPRQIKHKHHQSHKANSNNFTPWNKSCKNVRINSTKRSNRARLNTQCSTCSTQYAYSFEGKYSEKPGQQCIEPYTPNTREVEDLDDEIYLGILYIVYLLNFAGMGIFGVRNTAFLLHESPSSNGYYRCRSR